MKIEEVLNDELVDVINKYAEAYPNIGSDLKKSVENTKNAEMIVPVLGMQGMGKSTLINSILKENIMPNDADETTCVPVEVKYGADEYGEVFFKDKSESKRANTLDDLAKYVDNVQNPGNKLNVSHIVLYRKRDILKGGLTLVDLPGVGSMTKENENTTKKYVENLCSAIFVIPTVPTIRNMEAIFIKAVWSQFANAIFVQNDFGESKREIEESVEYNSMRLKEISESLKNPYDGKIYVVNAYNALVGSLNNDAQLIEKSNVNELISKIEQLAKNWEEDKKSAIVFRLQNILNGTLNCIETKIEECGKSKEEIRKQREVELDNYNSETRRLRSSLDSVKTDFEMEVESMLMRAKAEVRNTTGKIRASMYKKIEAGIFDGDNLTQAFSDEQQTYLSVFFDDRIEELNNLNFKIQEKIQDIIEEYTPVNVEDKRVSGETVDLENKWKYEQLFAPAGSILGGVAGTALGLKAGAAIGSAIFPGIGTAVGAVIGGLCALVGGYLGSKGQKSIEAKRIAEAKNEIKSIIDELETKLESRISSNINKFKDNVISVFDNFKQMRRTESNRLKENINNIPESEGMDVLIEDKNFVVAKIEEVKHV